jgi:hypothetical protein
MKRILTAALAAACAMSLVPNAPAAAEETFPPRHMPRFVRPELFRGFLPIQPDEFGLSPDQRFLVFHTARRGLTVLRLADDRVVFQDRSPDRFAGVQEVGFDPLDNRLFILTRDTQVEGTWRFRFVNLRTGRVLTDQRFPFRPEIRTNQNATVNVLAMRRPGVSRVLLLNAAGRITRRLNYDPLVSWGISRFGASIAFVNPISLGRRRIEVFNTRTGRPTFRTGIDPLFEVGYEPFGPAFVVSEPTSPSTFRVRMVHGGNGRAMLNRSFQGTNNAGFTPDGSLLGVQGRQGFGNELFLFRTRDGRQVFR